MKSNRYRFCVYPYNPKIYMQLGSFPLILMEVQMARNQNPHPPDRAKVRVFYGEADGSSQSIQDLVRLLGVVVRPPQYAVPHNQTHAGALAAPPSPTQAEIADEDRPLFDGLEEVGVDVVNA